MMKKQCEKIELNDGLIDQSLINNYRRGFLEDGLSIAIMIMSCQKHLATIIEDIR